MTAHRIDDDDRAARLLPVVIELLAAIVDGSTEERLDALVEQATHISGHPRFSDIIFTDGVEDPDEIVRRALAYKPSRSSCVPCARS